MSAQHTPGPWKVDESTGFVYCEIGDREPGICNTQCHELEAFQHETAIANARLIAAAPELLEAIEGLMIHVSPLNDMPEVEFARAAIAKAKGEA